MKKITAFIVCTALLLTSYPWRAGAAGTSNPKMNFFNQTSGAYYNLLDKNKGFSLEFGVTGGLEPDDALGSVLTVQRPESSTETRNPRISHYWAYTNKTNAPYLAFMYKYTGKDTTSRMIYQYNNQSTSVEAITIKGDGEWRVGVFDFSSAVSNASGSHIQYYMHEYFSEQALHTTQLQAANYNIFRNDPRITALDFDIEPRAGGQPKTEKDIVLGTGDNYVINSIQWYDGSGDEIEGAFEKDKVYKAEISMTANENYVFADTDWSLEDANRVTVKNIDSYLYQNTIVLEAEFDTISLKAEAVDIADGQTDVSVVDTALNIRFNKKLDSRSILAEGAVSVEPYAPFHMEVSDDFSAKLVFEETLALDTKYTVNFSGSILSAGGLALEPFSMDFTTVKSLPSPTIAVSAPADGEKNVARDTEVRINFDMAMNSQTLTKENITVLPEIGYSIRTEGNNAVISFDQSLEYETEYTVFLSDGIQSIYGTAVDPVQIRFTTVPPVKNLVENGFFENHEDLSMFSDANNNTSIKYVQEDGDWMLKWTPGWAAAPVIQSFDYSAGRQYYISMRVKSDTAQKLHFTVYYDTQAGENMYHNVAGTAVNANEWTTIQTTYTIPNTYISEKSPSIRIVSDIAKSNILISSWEMYDMTAAPRGNAAIVSVTPENNTAELAPEGLEMIIAFDKPMLPSSFTKANITSTPAAIQSVRLDKDLTTCTIAFGKLAVNQKYSVKVGSGVKTLYGDSVTPETLNFSTYTVTNAPMSVVSTSPADGAVNVNSNHLEMNVVFDTYPDISTLTLENITSAQGLIKEIVPDEDDPRTVTVLFDDEVLAMDTEYIVRLSSGIKSMTGYPLNEKTVTFRTKSEAYIISLFQKAATGQDTGLMKVFMEEQFDDLKVSCDLYEYLRNKESTLLEALYATLLGSSAGSALEIGEAVRKSVIFVMADKCTEPEDVEALIKSQSLGLADANAGKTYHDLLDDTGRLSVCGNIISANFSQNTDISTYVAEQIILTALKQANGWENVKTVLHLNKEAFQDNISIEQLLDKTDSLQSSSAVYKKLQNLEKDTLKGVYDALAAAYASAAQGNGGGGSRPSGGSAGGASGGTGYVPQHEAVVEKQTDIFNDVGGVSWAKDSIEALYGLGIVSGREKGMFAPSDKVTREEFVKMLVMAANVYDETAQAEFDDVSSSAWAYPYIASAAKHGLVSGIGDGMFGFGSNISREDVAVLIHRLAVETGIEAENAAEAFPDLYLSADYAKESVLFLHNAGIVMGDENGYFNPKSHLTRAEAAVILYKLVQMLP